MMCRYLKVKSQIQTKFSIIKRTVDIFEHYLFKQFNCLIMLHFKSIDWFLHVWHIGLSLVQVTM